MFDGRKRAPISLSVTQEARFPATICACANSQYYCYFPLVIFCKKYGISRRRYCAPSHSGSPDQEPSACGEPPRLPPPALPILRVKRGRGRGSRARARQGPRRQRRLRQRRFRKTRYPVAVLLRSRSTGLDDHVSIGMHGHDPNGSDRAAQLRRWAGPALIADFVITANTARSIMPHSKLP